jgi:hypothetical protein
MRVNICFYLRPSKRMKLEFYRICNLINPYARDESHAVENEHFEAEYKNI